jgi:hypothetical protein
VPQVFSRHQVLWAKLTLLAIAAIVVTAVVVWHNTMGLAFALDAPVAQPIPFSHKHHVGDDGIDCRYCHNKVEVSGNAGMPATETCASCHSHFYNNQPLLAPIIASYESGRPMHWRRVYDLPDFVYFDHSIHIHKGIGCVSCHGQVDTMPLLRRHASLNMEWCLGCHRDPAAYVRPRDKVFDLHWQPPPDRRALGKALVAKYHIRVGKLTECSLCHR